jgi:hypothetical protein
MDRDALASLIEEAIEAYFELLDDLNDTDSQDLAENITAAVLAHRSRAEGI